MTRGSSPDGPGEWVEAPPDDEADRTAAASAPAIDRSVKTRAMDEAPVGITVADATRPDMPLVYANGAFERITGYPSSYAIGRNCRFLQGEDTREEPVARLREAIEAAESTSVVLRNYRRNGNVFWNEVTIAPLRNDRGEVVYYVGFQQDVTRRKRAERAAARRATRIDRERAAQQRLLERLDGVVVDATAAVTEARSRTTLESGVVERLAETYAGAWIGAYDPADGAVVPRADAGTTGADGPPERVDVGTAAETTAVDAAVSRAIDHERVEVRPPGDGGPVVAGVPLHYGAATYGAVCVYARGGAGFDDHERAVLTALGRVIGTGLNALESHRTLRADGSVELRFGLQDHPLVPVADALGAHLTYAGTVSDRDRPTVLYEVEGAGAPTTRDAVSTSPADLRAVLVADDDACLVELTLPERGLHDLPTEYGATLCGATVDGATARVTVEVARESLARSLAEAVTDRFDGAEVTGYRRRDRSPETRREFVATLKRDLTDRQYAALLRAYTGGFFEWPHEATGEDLADAMDISRSTFHQHLRAAERKLVAAVLGDEADPN